MVWNRLLLLHGFCWALVSAHALDISGLALGSSLADAKGTLNKVNPALTFKSFRSRDGSRLALIGRELGTRVSAYDGKVEEFVRDEYVVVAAQTGIIRYVEHNVKTTQNRLLDHQQIVQALRAHYGGPSSQSSPNGRPEVLVNQIAWESDTLKRAYVGPAESGPCGPPLTERFEYSDGVIDMARVGRDGCGTLVVAKVPRPTVDGIAEMVGKPLGLPFEGKISSYSVFILDGIGFAK